MGLLDQVLGSVLGGAGAGGGTQGGGRGGLGGPLGMGGGTGGGGGMSTVLMSLLPVVLGMVANRSAGSGASPSSGVGGLGGMGGLGGLLEQFQQKGYGDHAQSWVGTGANQSLPPEALNDVLGHDRITQIADQAGVSHDDARHGLSQLLPELFDHFTPHGQMPPTDQLHASIDDFERQLPR